MDKKKLEDARRLQEKIEKYHKHITSVGKVLAQLHGQDKENDSDQPLQATVICIGVSDAGSILSSFNSNRSFVMWPRFVDQIEFYEIYLMRLKKHCNKLENDFENL